MCFFSRVEGVKDGKHNFQIAKLKEFRKSLSLLDWEHEMLALQTTDLEAFYCKNKTRQHILKSRLWVVLWS